MKAAAHHVHDVLIRAALLFTLVDGVMFAFVSWQGRHPSRALTDFYRLPASRLSDAPPNGYTSAGSKDVFDAKNDPGWVVRYAAVDCRYCREDEPLWHQLSTKLQRRGYKVIVMVPAARDAYPSNAEALDGATQEVFVSMSWITRFRLNGTPTLLIIERERGLIWAHDGMLDAEDSAAALKAIGVSSGK